MALNSNYYNTNSDNGVELFLPYKIEILKNGTSGIDYKSSIIKRNLNFAEIVETKPIFMKDELRKKSAEKGLYAPIATEDFIDTIYTEFEQDGYVISIILYKIYNSELLTQETINNGTAKNLATCIHRTINLVNNLLTDYDKYYDVELDNIIRVLSQPRFYNMNNIYVNDPLGQYFGPTLMINEFPLNEILNLKLYDYQKDNINWMLEIERNPISDYFCGHKLLFFPDGRIYNYFENRFIKNEDRELIPLKGGLVLDEVGVGKTLQFLCLAVSNSSINTMCLVPDHLLLQWKEQWIKHFNIDIPNNIKFVKFSALTSADFAKYNIHRLIVDEIHELYSNPAYASIFAMVLNTGCTFKWGISATPFPVGKSIFNIIKFLTEREYHYDNMERFLHFYDTYYKMFRKNTLSNIVKEIKLPDSIEHNLILEFNSQERLLYDAETQAKNNCDMEFLRKCCCDAMINYNDGSLIVTLQDFHYLIINDYKKKIY